MNPRHQPSAEQRKTVEAMAGYGIPHDDIAVVIGIDPKTLRLHYRAELDRGHVIANTKVAENLYKIATGTGREAVTAAIFWLKVRAGWNEHSPLLMPKSDALGKKDAANLDAETAHEGTEWGHLVH